MACPITIRNTTANPLTLSDLSGMVLQPSTSPINIEQLFTTEELSKSTSLAPLVTNGSISLFVAGAQVTDVSSLCPNSIPSYVPASTWIWTGYLKGSINVSSIDFTRFSGTGTNEMPFVSPYDVEIISISILSDTASEWGFEILVSSDDGATWTTLLSESGVPSKKEVYNLEGLGYGIFLGDLVRFRFIKGADAITNPQINVLVKG